MKYLLTILVLVAACYSSQLSADVDTQNVNFDVEAATMAYLNKLKPEERLASDSYFEGGYWLILSDLLYGLLIAWALLHFRLSTKMRDIGKKFTRSPYLNSVAYIVQYTLLEMAMQWKKENQ